MKKKYKKTNQVNDKLEMLELLLDFCEELHDLYSEIHINNNDILERISRINLMDGVVDYKNIEKIAIGIPKYSYRKKAEKVTGILNKIESCREGYDLKDDSLGLVSRKNKYYQKLYDELFLLQERITKIADAQNSTVKIWNSNPLQENKFAFRIALDLLHTEFKNIKKIVNRLQVTLYL